MYKVYKHTVPNGKIYIGITSLDVENRWKKGKGYKNSILFSRAINKYKWENIKHEILFDGLTKEDAEIKEIELIKTFKSNDKKHGYNIENGGQTGATGIKRSNETLTKMRNANLGKTVSEEVKSKISNSLKGRIFSEEHRAKKSSAQMGEKNHRYGKKASIETRNKMSEKQLKGAENPLSKKIVQISKDTQKVINVWDSMGDIRRTLGFKHCGISDCCRDIQKTSHGFIWKYFEE